MAYSPEEKQAALDCLAAHDGNYHQASEATGISQATLRKWAREAQVQGDEVQQLRAGLEAFERYVRAGRDSLGDALDVSNWLFDDLPLELARTAVLMLGAVDEMIDDAPLNQRIAALSKCVDLIIKLRNLQPQSGEQVVYVQYIDPADDTPHDAPFWAADNSEDESAL